MIEGRAVSSGAMGAWLLLAAVAVAPPAAAGTRMVTETRRVEGGGGVGRAQLYVEGPRLRLDPADGKSSVIYRSEAGEIWMLDHEERTVLSLNKEQTRKAAAGLTNLRKEIDARVAGLPEEQRQAMERLTNQMLPEAAEAPEISVRPLGSGDVVQGIVCHDVEILRDGAPMAVACRASYGAAGIAPDALRVVEELAKFFEESVSALLPKDVRRQTVDAFGSLEELDGVPMRVRTYDGNRQPDRETLVTELVNGPLPEATFAIPDGYSQALNINIREGFGGP